MMKTKQASGYRQFTVIWVISIVTLVFGLLLFHWVTEREQLLETVHTEAAVIGSNAGAVLVFNDKQAADEILAVLAHLPHVLEAALYRSEGDLLAVVRTGRGDAVAMLGERAPAIGTVFSLREMRMTMPISLDQRTVGAIALRISQDGLYREILYFGLGYVLIASIVTALAYLATGRLRQRLRKYQDDLEESHARLRNMLAHRETLLEAEHKRIAMEIHDELGQILTAALMNLRLIERGYGRDADVGQLISDAQGQLDAAYRGMKNIATALHPAVLQFGFVPAVEWLAERILKLAGIRWTIDVETPLPALDQRQSMALFRIVQESLTNVVRHSSATSVGIAIRTADGALVLEVSDDGCGPNFARNEGDEMKFGLIGMRERAESIGAHVTIRPLPGKGTLVRVAVPLASEVRSCAGKETDDI